MPLNKYLKRIGEITQTNNNINIKIILKLIQRKKNRTRANCIRRNAVRAPASNDAGGQKLEITGEDSNTAKALSNETRRSLSFITRE